MRWDERKRNEKEERERGRRLRKEKEERERGRRKRKREREGSLSLHFLGSFPQDVWDNFFGKLQNGGQRGNFQVSASSSPLPPPSPTPPPGAPRMDCSNCACHRLLSPSRARPCERSPKHCLRHCHWLRLDMDDGHFFPTMLMVILFFQGTIAIDGFPMVLSPPNHRH